MKLKMWIHTMLHIGCVALLLWQGHRIQQVQKLAVERREVETKQQFVQQFLHDRAVERHYLMSRYKGTTVVSGHNFNQCGCYRWGDPVEESDTAKTYLCTCGFESVPGPRRDESGRPLN